MGYVFEEVFQSGHVLGLIDTHALLSGWIIIITVELAGIKIVKSSLLPEFFNAASSRIKVSAATCIFAL